MKVQILLETQLAQDVPDDADGPSEHEEGIDGFEVNELPRLLLGELDFPQQIATQYPDATVNIQDQIVSFTGGDSFHLQGIFQILDGGKLFPSIANQDPGPFVRVCDRLYTVADAGNVSPLCFHFLHEAFGASALVVIPAENGCGIVYGTAESGSYSQQPARQGAHHVLAGSGRNDCIVGTRDRGAVIRGYHQEYLPDPDRARINEGRFSGSVLPRCHCLSRLSPGYSFIRMPPSSGELFITKNRTQFS